MGKDSKELVRKTVGQNIRTLRLSHSMSIEELARRMELTPGFIGLMERGRRCATAESLTKLSKIFHVSADVLLHPSEAERAEKNTKAVHWDKIQHIQQNLDKEELDFVCSILPFIKRLKT